MADQTRRAPKRAARMPFIQCRQRHCPALSKHHSTYDCSTTTSADLFACRLGSVQSWPVTGPGLRRLWANRIIVIRIRVEANFKQVLLMLLMDSHQASSRCSSLRMTRSLHVSPNAELERPGGRTRPSYCYGLACCPCWRTRLLHAGLESVLVVPRMVSLHQPLHSDRQYRLRYVRFAMLIDLHLPVRALCCSAWNDSGQRRPARTRSTWLERLVPKVCQYTMLSLWGVKEVRIHLVKIIATM